MRGGTKMTTVSLAKQAKVVGVEVPAPALRVLDVDGIAEVVLTQALESCAQKMGLESSQAMVDCLRQGDIIAYRNFHDSLAGQLAQQLAALDEEVKAAYIDEYDASPEDLWFGEAARTTVIYLIVWAKRKTGALTSLVAALDRALVKAYADLSGTPQLSHIWEAQVIDDADVKNRVGYGALLSSIHFPPTEVWRRQAGDTGQEGLQAEV
jgi:hypothetical protein